MENEEKQKREEFIKKIKEICSKKDKLGEFLKDPINVDNIKEVYLVNKVILDYYSKLLSTITNNKKDNSIDFNKIEKESNIISLLFLEPELLIINNFKFSYNFYIVTKDLLDLIVVKENKNNSFTPYNIFIAEEGIFIWKNQPKQNDYHLIYYLIDNNSEINKIYLYKNIQDFKDEFKNNILGKKMNEYFSFRNIRKKEIGFFNIINDGNIIGKYFNLIKENDFKFDEELTDESTIQITQNYLIKEDKEFRDFLTYLLIGLYYINDLYIILNERDENLKNDKNKLINIFCEFVSYFKTNNKPNNDHINEFINIFFSKGLNETIYYNKKNNRSDNQFYLDIIDKIINQFYNELFKENLNLNNNNNNSNNNNNILNEFCNLFFSSKNNQDNKIQKFFMLYINKKKFENEKQKNLEKILNDLYSKEENIINLPEILIIILDNKEVSIDIPLELNIRKEKKHYSLLIWIPKAIDRTYSISYENNKDNNEDNNNDNNKNNIIWENYFFDLNNFNKYIVGDNNEIKNLINNSIIFFYKYKKEISFCSGKNEIYNKNIDMKFDMSTYIKENNKNDNDKK